MSLGRSPCDSLVLKDNKASVKVADFNNPSMCVCAAILNWLRSVTSSSTRFCQLKNTCDHSAPRYFQIRHGSSHLGSQVTWRSSLVIKISELNKIASLGLHGRCMRMGHRSTVRHM